MSRLSFLAIHSAIKKCSTSCTIITSCVTVERVSSPVLGKECRLVRHLKREFVACGKQRVRQEH